MKRLFLSITLSIAISFTLVAQTPQSWKALRKDVNIFMVNDLGQNGYYDQKPIAELMGAMAEKIRLQCIIAAGDVHHFNGVQSVSDPLWMTNYELIYSHPRLMVEWLPVLGNHEYRGNTQAVLDYSSVSRRWAMPGRYYTRVFKSGGTSVRVVMIDTAPMIEGLRKNNTKYPEVGLQEREPQLRWLESVLADAKEDWVLVVGHHPIYAYSDKSKSERKDMQQYVDTILRKFDNVAMYLCGHIHNFQHLRVEGSNIDYVVNTSASLSRKVKPIEQTLFCSPLSGFSVISANEKELTLSMIDKDGNVIYSVKRTK